MMTYVIVIKGSTEVRFKLVARNRDHALEKLPALRGNGLLPTEELLTWWELQDEKRFIAECLKFPLSDDQL